MWPNISAELRETIRGPICWMNSTFVLISSEGKPNIKSRSVSIWDTKPPEPHSELFILHLHLETTSLGLRLSQNIPHS